MSGGQQWCADNAEEMRRDETENDERCANYRRQECDIESSFFAVVADAGKLTAALMEPCEGVRCRYCHQAQDAHKSCGWSGEWLDCPAQGPNERAYCKPCRLRAAWRVVCEMMEESTNGK